VKNLTPETAYALSAVASLVLFTLGWLIGRRGKKKG
jgi:uncharacterized membrane protein